MKKQDQKTTVISAFTEDQVERLTGISVTQLRYWDRTGFLAPSLANENRRLPYSRLYTFRDLVSLKVLNALRNESKVSLAHLRDVKERLAHLGDDIWASTVLYVLNKQVVFHNPDTGALEEVVSQQGVLSIPLKVVAGELHAAVDAMKKREGSEVGQIAQSRNVAHNQQVIAGTRIPVRSIKAFADAGYSVEQIIEQYPSLTREDIEAAIAHKAA